MNRSRFVYFILIILIVAGIAFLTRLANNLYENEDQNESETISLQDELDNYVQYTVGSGEFVASENVKGYVVYDNAIVELEKYIPRNILKVSVGEMVKKNDVLCENENYKMLSECNGKVIEIENNNNLVRVEIVDYSNAYIVANIPYDKQNIINNKSVVYGAVNGNKQKKLKIKKIIPMIEENSYAVFFDNKFPVYENTEVGIEIEYDYKKNAVCVPKEFVKKSNEEGAYVLLIDSENNVEKYSVVIGEENTEVYEIKNGQGLIGKNIAFDKREKMVNLNENDEQ